MLIMRWKFSGEEENRRNWKKRFFLSGRGKEHHMKTFLSTIGIIGRHSRLFSASPARCRSDNVYVPPRNIRLSSFSTARSVLSLIGASPILCNPSPVFRWRQPVVVLLRLRLSRNCSSETFKCSLSRQASLILYDHLYGRINGSTLGKSSLGNN